MESTSLPRHFKLLTVFVLSVICIRCQALQQTDVVQTSAGPVQGYIQKTLFLGVEYSTFKGIKFGEPPVGERRFLPPIPKKPWTDVLNATEEGPTCPQVDMLFDKNTYMGDEDCLNLNVYSPLLNFNTTDKRPVMVWIYGGGFSEGYKNQSLYGPDFFIEEGVVLVAINYRIGALGFLNLGLPGAHGNAGMMDQVLAFKWVRQNIANFGGDPTNVTIFGESAGSSSVILHELSPQSRGLYDRSISQSGAPLIFLSQTPSVALTSAYVLAARLGFYSLDRQKLLAFYRNASAYDLATATTFMYIYVDVVSRPFQPSREDPSVVDASEIFLSDCPITLMMDGQIRKGPKMIGFVHNEAYAFAEPLYIDKLLNLILPYNATVAVVRAFTQIVTNTTYAAEIELTQRFFAAHNDLEPVYFYVMNYADFPRHLITSLPVFEPAHGDDLGLLFTSPLYGIVNSTDPNDPRNVFRRKFVKLWVNFANTSNPTPPSDTQFSALWQPSQLLGLQYVIDYEFKTIRRSLGISGSLPESIYYYLLPLCSECRKISYATPFTDLFALDEVGIPSTIGDIIRSLEANVLFSYDTLLSVLKSITVQSVIDTISPVKISSVLSSLTRNSSTVSVINPIIDAIQTNPVTTQFLNAISANV